jgi:hypothetical protein
MGTHISLLGNIYSYGSYPGYYSGINLAAATDLLGDVLNKRLHFRLLCDHLMGVRLVGIHFIGMTSWACI